MAMSLKHHQSIKKSPQLILLLTVLVTVWFTATITVQIRTISNSTNEAIRFCDKNITNFEIIDIFRIRKEEPKNFKDFLVLVRFRIDRNSTIKRGRNQKIRRFKHKRCLIELRPSLTTKSLPRIFCHSNSISQLIIGHLRDGATIRRLQHNHTLSERQQNSTKIIKRNPLWIKFNNKINDHSFKKLIGCAKVRSRSTTIDKNVDPITKAGNAHSRSSSQNGQEDSKKMRTWTTRMMMMKTGIFGIKYRGEDKKQVKESLKIGHIIGIVAVVVSCLVIGVILYCCLCHRKPPRVTKKTSGGGGHHKSSHH